MPCESATFLKLSSVGVCRFERVWRPVRQFPTGAAALVGISVNSASIIQV
jgi:hypothetical protein